MIKIATVINTIATDLAAETWSSDDGGGTSQLQAVYTYPNYFHTGGYPFACVYDIPAAGESQLNTKIDWEHEIRIEICVNFAVTTGADDDAKRAEAMLRLREAWDYLKGYISKDQRRTDWLGGNQGWHYNFDVNDDIVEDANIYRRTIRFRIKEEVSRL